MRILLTGSSGWLGRHLAPLLRQAGHDVFGLDVAPGTETHLIGSVAVKGAVGRAFSRFGPDAVIHAGALHKPDMARFSTQAFIDVNVTGTLNLAEAALSAGHDRFVFTSTTSLMISERIRAGEGDAAAWLDEGTAPLEPRNAYGVTKLAAEHLLRVAHHEKGLNVVLLRTARFFPEEDDSDGLLPGPNLKANEFLHRRLTVKDAARAHLHALEWAPRIGFGTYILSAPTPFSRNDAAALRLDAPAVIRTLFPDAEALYRRKGWLLPRSIDRVYDAGLAERELGFRCEVDFAAILDALRTGAPMPFVDDPGYVSPSTLARPGMIAATPGTEP